MGNSNNPYSEQYGFRVIEIKPGSPAEKSQLQVSTDFIISINGKYLNDLDTGDITRLVAESEGKSMHLWVWNSLTDSNREVGLTPSRNWPGEGLLGVIIRYDRYDADKKSSEQNMAFDQLYEGQGDEMGGVNEKLGGRKDSSLNNNGENAEENNNSKSRSFFNLPGLSKKKSMQVGRTVDLDSEFTFDKIYQNNTFSENSPMGNNRKGPSSSNNNNNSNSKSTLNGYSNNNSPAVSSNSIQDPSSPEPQQQEAKSPKKRLSLTHVFSFGGGGQTTEK